MQAHNLAQLYDLEVLDWTAVTERLDRGFTQAPGTGGPDRHSSWLTTLDADGAPHTTGIGSAWLDGTFWFETGQGTRKGRNLARDPRCTLALALDEFDLVVSGRAAVVLEPATVAQLAEHWSTDGWACRVDESGTALTADFSAPSAGAPPWHVYRITPTSAVVLQTVEPGGATRFDF
jgi:hypothetical protein